MSITMLTNSAMILLLDNQIVDDYKQFVTESEDSIGLMIGFKDHRKAIIKFLVPLSSEFIGLINKILETNELEFFQTNKPAALLELLDYNYQTLFLKLINFIKGLPEGVQMLGFVYWTLNSDDLTVFEPELILSFMKHFIELKELIILTCNRLNFKKILVYSSNVGTKIDFLCKDGIIDRHPLIEISLQSILSISRIFYPNYELQATDLINYFSNTVKSLLSTAFLKLIIKDGDLEITLKGKSNDKLSEIIEKTNLKPQNLYVKLLYNIKQSEFEDNTHKNTADALSYLLKLNSKLIITLFCPVDLELKQFEESMKAGISNTMNQRIINHIDNRKLDSSNRVVFATETDNYSYIRVLGLFTVELNMNSSSFRVENYESLFPPQIKLVSTINTKFWEVCS